MCVYIQLQASLRQGKMDLQPALVLVILSLLLNRGAAIGVNYGTVADDLPQPSTVVGLIRDLPISVRHVKIFAPDQSILDAFSNTEFKLVVGVANEEIPGFASSVAAASEWVRKNISPYAKIVQTVVVGNEVFLSQKQLNTQLVPAMKNLKTALDQNNHGGIQVTTPVNGEVLEIYYPPSDGKFRTNEGLDTVVPQLLDFLSSHSYPFMVKVYPYFAWRDNQKDIPLDYALFQLKTPRFSDNGHGYTNLFDATVDCVVAALEKKGHGDLKIVIGESGWPSGPKSQAGTSVENARKYNQGLVDHVKMGTPRRPGLMGAYVFALFNENNKDDDGTKPWEKHWGLLYPTKEPVYNLSD